MENALDLWVEDKDHPVLPKSVLPLMNSLAGNAELFGDDLAGNPTPKHINKLHELIVTIGIYYIPSNTSFRLHTNECVSMGTVDKSTVSRNYIIHQRA